MLPLRQCKPTVLCRNNARKKMQMHTRQHATSAMHLSTQTKRDNTHTRAVTNSSTHRDYTCRRSQHKILHSREGAQHSVVHRMREDRYTTRASHREPCTSDASGTRLKTTMAQVPIAQRTPMLRRQTKPDRPTTHNETNVGRQICKGESLQQLLSEA